MAKFNGVTFLRSPSGKHQREVRLLPGERVLVRHWVTYDIDGGVKKEPIICREAHGEGVCPICRDFVREKLYFPRGLNILIRAFDLTAMRNGGDAPTYGVLHTSKTGWKILKQVFKKRGGPSWDLGDGATVHWGYRIAQSGHRHHHFVGGKPRVVELNEKSGVYSMKFKNTVYRSSPQHISEISRVPREKEVEQALESMGLYRRLKEARI